MPPELSIMDTGLLKLWSRKSMKKIKSNPEATGNSASLKSHLSPFRYESTTAGPTPQMGTLPYRPSLENQPRKKSFRHKKAKSEALQELKRLVDSDPHVRWKSAAGIQPVVVSISRPSTANSLYSTVEQVAEKGTESKLKPVQQAASLPTAAAKIRGPRYVDLLSITTTGINANGSVYNEDIAERNIEAHSATTPTSSGNQALSSPVHQQEDLNHNASLSSSRDASFESIRNSKDYSRSSFEGGLIATKHAYTHSPSTEYMGTRRPAQNGFAHHSRQYSSKIKTLPSILQEPLVEGSEASRETATTELSTNGVDDEQTSYTQDGLSPPKPKVVANEGRPLKAGLSKDVKARMEEDQVYRPDGMPFNYQFSSREMEQACFRSEVPFSRVTDNSQEGHRIKGDSNTTGSDLVRRLSFKGDGSHLRKAVALPNRTVMDLTGDDSEVFIDSDAEADGSPVIQHATLGSIKLIRPQIVTTPSPRGSKTRVPLLADATKSSDSLTRFTGPQLFAQAAMANASMSRSIQTGDSSEQSQASSVVNCDNEVSMVPDSAELNAPHHLPNNASKEPETPAAIRDTTTYRGIRNASPAIVPGILRMADLSTPAAITQPIIEPEAATQLLVTTPAHSEGGHEVFQKKPMLKALYEDETLSTSQSSTTKPSETGSARSPHTSPESLSSNDLLASDPPPAVATRDFAVATPRRPLQPRQGPAVTNNKVTSKFGAEETGKKSARTGAGKGRVRATSSIDDPFREDSFDETAFARKQVAARAALAKLQQSLDETFDLPSKAENLRHLGKEFERSRTATPTSIFSIPRAVALTTRGGLATKEEMPAAPPEDMSYYTLATAAATATAPFLSDIHNNPAADKQQAHQLSPDETTTPNRPFELGLGGSGSPISPVTPSLGAFPLPPAPGSPSRGRVAAGVARSEGHVRMGSTYSRTSNASIYTLPLHMVPDRSSSMRDFDVAYGRHFSIGEASWE